jgi:hypothetical protein
MTDTQRININKPIDNGGITFSWPSSSQEGKNSEKETQNLTQLSSNFLNKYKLDYQSREELLFPTLYSLMQDGSLGIYQSNLPYPGLSNYSLKSSIDIGINTHGLLRYNHYILIYNNTIYVIYPTCNIKTIDTTYNVVDIDIGNRFDAIFSQNQHTLLSVIDSSIYQIDLLNKTSSLIGSIPNIDYPIRDGFYNSSTDQIVLLNRTTSQSGQNSIYFIDYQTLNIQHAITTTSPVTDIYELNNKAYIIGGLLFSTEVDLTNYSEVTKTADAEQYVEKPIINIDLFGNKRVHLDYLSNKQSLYIDQNFIGNIKPDISVLEISAPTNTAFILQNNQNRFACILDSIFDTSNNLQIITQLD